MRSELATRGHELRDTIADSRPLLTSSVHAHPYAAFPESEWEPWLALDPANVGRQPFHSVWPVRALRSDVEPVDFIAWLGPYSIANGTPFSAESWAVARAAAGAAVSAADLMAAGARAVFCATRSPGLHVGADFMGGYRFLNNAALAAQALRPSDCKRVAALDVELHRGDVTQAIFYERADVLCVSLHGRPAHRVPVLFGPRG